MNEIRNILNKIEPLLEDNSRDNIMDSLSDFTNAVKKGLSKKAERMYRKSGESWDSRINELEKEYLDSLQIKENPAWIQYSFTHRGNKVVIAYVAKKPKENIDVGDVVFPTPDKKQRPDVSRKPILNVFSINYDIDDILF